MSDTGRFHTQLTIKHLSRTRQRDEIYRAIMAVEPFTPQQLVNYCRPKVSRDTVYRAIRRFLDIDVIIEIRPGWYELTDRFQQHHHYFICRHCDRRTSFNDERIEIDLGKFAEGRGLVLEDHRLELIGLCRDCTVNNDKPRASIGTNLRRLPG